MTDKYWYTNLKIDLVEEDEYSLGYKVVGSNQELPLFCAMRISGIDNDGNEWVAVTSGHFLPFKKK